MATTGQTINDRLNAVRYALVGQGLARTVCKSTTEEVLGPKKKHIDYLIACTNEPNVSIPQLANLLIERTQHASWAVVFKSLITIHHLMSYGNERFTQYLATSNHSFELADFMDRTSPQGYNMSTFVRRYAKYINDKSISYRSLAIDLCKIRSGNDNALRTMNMENLSKTLPIVQSQFDSLLDFGVEPKDLNNGIVMSAFRLLYKDLVRLYVAYQEAIINLLERYFKLSRRKTREALEMYKKYLARMDKVAGFLRIVDAVGLDKSEMPDLTKSPQSILEILEKHLAQLEAKKRGGLTTPTSPPTDNSPTAAAAAAASSASDKENELPPLGADSKATDQAQSEQKADAKGAAAASVSAKSGPPGKAQASSSTTSAPPGPPPSPSPGKQQAAPKKPPPARPSPIVSPKASPPGAKGSKPPAPSGDTKKAGPPERPAKPPSRPPPPSAAAAQQAAAGPPESAAVATSKSPPPPHPAPPVSAPSPSPIPASPETTSGDGGRDASGAADTAQRGGAAVQPATAPSPVPPPPPPPPPPSQPQPPVQADERPEANETLETINGSDANGAADPIGDYAVAPQGDGASGQPTSPPSSCSTGLISEVVAGVPSDQIAGLAAEDAATNHVASNSVNSNSSNHAPPEELQMPPPPPPIQDDVEQSDSQVASQAGQQQQQPQVVGGAPEESAEDGQVAAGGEEAPSAQVNGSQDHVEAAAAPADQ